MVEIHANVN